MSTFLSKLLFDGKDAPPAPTDGSPPLRPLMLPRIIATFENIFAVSGNTPADNQKDVYISGDGSVFDGAVQGGTPSWIPCDFSPLGPSKTGRCKMPLPDNFTLLAFMASASVNTKGGFRLNVYDINRRIRFTERPVNFNAFAGTGSSPLFLGGDWGTSRFALPYQFQPTNAQCMITVVNLETVNNNIELVMYGIQGGHPRAQ
jgi:hypothetical protein